MNVGANVGATITQEKYCFFIQIIMKDFLPKTSKKMLAVSRKMLAHVGGCIKKKRKPLKIKGLSSVRDRI